MRQHKTKAVPRRAEEPVEPVEATTTPPADTSATDKLLDTIEEILDEAAVEQVKFRAAEYEEQILRAMGIPGPSFRGAKDQEKLREMFLAEREARFEPEPEDVPWEEIAKLPMPPPGGTEVIMVEPLGLDYDFRDDAVCIQAPYRERRIRVTMEMWREAQFRVGPAQRKGQSYGDNGLCGICGWPLAGPGGPPCGTAGTRPL